MVNCSNSISDPEVIIHSEYLVLVLPQIVKAR